MTSNKVRDLPAGLPAAINGASAWMHAEDQFLFHSDDRVELINSSDRLRSIHGLELIERWDSFRSDRSAARSLTGRDTEIMNRLDLRANKAVLEACALARTAFVLVGLRKGLPVQQMRDISHAKFENHLNEVASGAKKLPLREVLDMKARQAVAETVHDPNAFNKVDLSYEAFTLLSLRALADQTTRKHGEVLLPQPSVISKKALTQRWVRP